MKSTLRRYLALTCVLLGAWTSSEAQSIYQRYNIYRNPIRVFLNKFSITATTGYGATTYKHDLSGVYFYQDLENQFIFNNNIENLGSTFSGFTDWLNDPQEGFQTSLENPFDVPFAYVPGPVNNPAIGNQTFLIDTDSAGLGFRGGASSIPITLQIHYAFREFRVGGGFTYEKQWIKALKPTSFGGVVRSYQPNFSSTSYARWFGLVGYKFYDFWRYDFVAELQVGRINAGKQFNSAAITRGMYANFGVSIENNWSEYFRLIIRPSIDFKKYTVNLPDGAAVVHSHPTFFIQVGLSINIPEIPRSPMKSDHVQLKHIYTDPKTGRLMEVRGQPIWKRQNPKIGENHRRMWPQSIKKKKKLRNE